MAVITADAFEKDTAHARRRAQDGPLIITDRRGPTQVLLSYEEYQRMRPWRSLADVLDDPRGGHIELPLPPRKVEPFRDPGLED